MAVRVLLWGQGPRTPIVTVVAGVGRPTFAGLTGSQTPHPASPGPSQGPTVPVLSSSLGTEYLLCTSMKWRRPGLPFRVLGWGHWFTIAQDMHSLAPPQEQNGDSHHAGDWRGPSRDSLPIPVRSRKYQEGPDAERRPREGSHSPLDSADVRVHVPRTVGVFDSRARPRGRRAWQRCPNSTASQPAGPGPGTLGRQGSLRGAPGAVLSWEPRQGLWAGLRVQHCGRTRPQRPWPPRSPLGTLGWALLQGRPCLSLGPSFHLVYQLGAGSSKPSGGLCL